MNLGADDHVAKPWRNPAGASCAHPIGSAPYAAYRAADAYQSIEAC